jgi:hypothetical protein
VTVHLLTLFGWTVPSGIAIKSLGDTSLLGGAPKNQKHKKPKTPTHARTHAKTNRNETISRANPRGASAGDALAPLPPLERGSCGGCGGAESDESVSRAPTCCFFVPFVVGERSVLSLVLLRVSCAPLRVSCTASCLLRRVVSLLRCIAVSYVASLAWLCITAPWLPRLSPPPSARTWPTSPWAPAWWGPRTS